MVLIPKNIQKQKNEHNKEKLFRLHFNSIAKQITVLIYNKTFITNN